MSNTTHLMSDSLLSFFSCHPPFPPSVLLLLFPALSISQLSSLFISLLFLSIPFSFSEQPVDHSLPVSWFLSDQQLCVQLPASVAPQPDHQPREWRFPPMVRLIIHTQTTVQKHYAYSRWTCIWIERNDRKLYTYSQLKRDTQISKCANTSGLYCS